MAPLHERGKPSHAWKLSKGKKDLCVVLTEAAQAGRPTGDPRKGLTREDIARPCIGPKEAPPYSGSRGTAKSATIVPPRAVRSIVVQWHVFRQQLVHGTSPYYVQGGLEGLASWRNRGMGRGRLHTRHRSHRRGTRRDMPRHTHCASQCVAE